ncbi:response regulator [Sulfuriflexus mobilis]|uniref:response regulator n=1 Tax=Sulfuriflexus mobilis TaxID=1811807 RepID=UPI000F82A280|nr:response regulator [Sulfuriflexus mobilis]
MSKILIADDNEHNLYIARFLLEDAGHETVQVTSGEEAVNTASADNFDLILMDIQMPGMDGIEATRRIKAAGVSAPIVALTAKAMSGDKEAILAAGCDGYISKPFEVEVFVAVVERYLSERRE